jgi:hypothetical protein
MAKGGAAAKASRILKDLVDEIDGLHESHTAHGLRAGAADDMLLNKLCNIIGAIFRGNWDFSGECVLFRHLCGKLFVSQAGKVLAGYTNPDQDVDYPSLDSITNAENKTLLNNFAHNLFNVAKLHGELKPFRDAMLASLLMNHEQFSNTYGRDHPVVDTLNGVAAAMSISVPTLCAWGKQIGEEFRQKNDNNFDASGGTEDQLRGLKQQITLLNTKVDKMTELMQNMYDQNEQLWEQIQNLRQRGSRGSPASGSKRSRLNEDANDQEETKEESAEQPPEPVNAFQLVMTGAARQHTPQMSGKDPISEMKCGIGSINAKLDLLKIK